MARPLTKVNKTTGKLYQRRSHVEALIEVIVALDRASAVKRLAIRDRKHSEYVPSEVLVHLLRETRQDNRSDHFEQLYRLLFNRIEGTLLSAVADSQYRNADEIRMEIISHLAEQVTLDQQHPAENLDIYEINFDAALHNLKIDYLRKLGPQRLKTGPLEDAQTGEVSADVEAAAQSFLGHVSNKFDDPAFRSALAAAIDALPDDERKVVGLLFQGLPIDAKDAKTVTIARTLNCTGRTVQNRRDKAFEKLRKALQSEYEP